MYLSARHEYFRNSTCPACNLLPLDALSKDETPAPVTIRLDQVDIADIKRFVRKCHFCQILVDLYGHWTSDKSSMPFKYDGVTYRSLCGRDEWRVRYTEQSHLGLFVDFGVVLAKRVDDRHIHESPLSPHTVRLMQHWMAKCERKHLACFDHPTTLPTRVIDVRGSTLKLADPSPSGTHQYVALSHCWGTCRSFLTTRENAQDRKRGFHLDELPATFQDAVEVTRRLDIAYLWIDSICILQGDREDWEIEGSKMADVYANATLTIAAANASDDAEGFLKPRAQSPTLTIDVCLHSTDGDSTHDRTTRIYTRLPPRTDLIYEPLDGRAWCLQERYLSSRILFFASDALRWECLGAGWFEAGRGLAKHKLMLPDVMPVALEGGALSHVPWYKMAELYTTRAITYAGDKLPALSALASRVAWQSGDEYLAGLWSEDLFSGLLWYRQVRRRFRDREPEKPFRNGGHSVERAYLAPTWSWASYPGAVQFLVTTPSETATKVLPSVSIVEATVLVPGKNPFGQVESGYLRLSVPLLSFKPAEGEDLSVGAWEHNRMWCLEVLDFGVDVGSSLDYPGKHRSVSLSGVPLLYSNMRDAVSEELAGGECRNRSRGWLQIHGILLNGVEKGGESVFERVGCFAIRPILSSDFLGVMRDVGYREVKII